MTYCIAVFKSRTEAMNCKCALVRSGISAELISTPSALCLGCGLSVKFPLSCAARAKAMIARHNYSSFYGTTNI